MPKWLSALLCCALLLWTFLSISGCSGGDDIPPPSTTSQPPTTSQEPTKPPPTTQPPSTAPPSTQPPGSQPPGSAPPGAFAQGTGFNSFVRTIVMAQDGTNDLYVGGDFTTYNGTAANHLIRLRPNGTVAQAFGQGFDEVVVALGLATDGSNALYAGGPFTQFNGQLVPQLVRLTANGLRDATFQPGSFGFGLLALAVTEDGSRDVYAAGNFVESVPGTPVTQTIGRIVRLNPDGSPDSIFPTNLRFPGVPDLSFPIVSCIAVPPGSGKLYVGGSMSVSFGGAPGSLLRLNADGSIDSTFAGGTSVPGIAGTTAVETIALAADGSRDLYAGGRIGSYNGTPVNNFSIRVHETGALDTTFAPTEPGFIVFTIAPAKDGSGDVFIFGFGRSQTTPVIVSPRRLVRLNRNGSLVSTFHEPTLPSEPSNEAFVLTIVPVLDGTSDLYIGGAFTTYNGVAVNHIARIHADGSLASVVN